MRLVLWTLILMVCLPACPVQAESIWESVDEIDDAYQKTGQTGEDFSVKKYVSDIYEGKRNFSPGDLFSGLLGRVASEMGTQKATLVKYIILGVISGICANFSDSFGDHSGGQVAFYVIYGVMASSLMTAFYNAYDVAGEAVEQLFAFMQALLPSFSLALCMGGDTGSAMGFYEVMILAMTLLEWGVKHIFLPTVELYFILCLLNPLTENRFSKMASLCQKGMQMMMKVFMMAILGYQGIQGLLLPVMDKVKNNSVMNAAKGIPGVGNAIGGAADTLVGSSVLIKSAIGVGGLICLVSLMIAPLIKMGVFTILYKLVAAFVQPVSDSKVSGILWSVANCGKLLFQCLFIGALVFFLSVVIILSATNLI